jgi:molybdopterin-guanine dinucleotide biosynthesis protein A
VRAPFGIGGYVLAGGKSSRMGRDKALLELAGVPLVARAVKKLRQVCSEVHVLSDNPALAEFAPLVRDLHPGCGPIGGMEAALAHSAFDWNLFLPVDMPFLPAEWMAEWVADCCLGPDCQRPDCPGALASSVRVHMVTVDGRPQPGFCLLHSAVLPFLSEAIQRGEFKLLTALQAAGRGLAGGQGLAANEATKGAPPRWFANLNTPEDVAEAEKQADELM